MKTEQIVTLLNKAADLDPAAVHSLICNRVPCNAALGEHATIQVGAQMGDRDGCPLLIVGLLGILNGIAALDGDLIEAVFDGGPVGKAWDPENPPAPVRFSGFRLRPKDAPA